MKKWYITNSTNIMVDDETDQAVRVDDNYTSLCNCYIAPEDCIVKFTDSNTKGFAEYTVKKGQIIFTFYNSKMPNQLVIFDCDALKENIEFYNKDLQDEKEKWAAEHAESKTQGDPINE